MNFGRAIPTPIRIMPTDSHGFIVDIGFATFACEGPESALRVLGDYLKHPSEFITEIESIRNQGKDTKKEAIQPEGPGPIITPPCGGGVKLASQRI